MKKSLSLLVLACCLSLPAVAQIDSAQLLVDNIERSLNYQTGKIELSSNNAVLTVPEGFKYLDQQQSMYVLTDLWGNPADSSILGLLVPANKGVLAGDSWVYTISFDNIGYVKDDDADDIDYDELLEDLQTETKDGNEARVKEGYQPITLVGWASKPYYDADKKILHWAKELQFGNDSLHTLNYNLRILGRKGVFVLNAVATMHEMPEVKASINQVIGSVTYKEGDKYSDYLPDVDDVATWTIGGLVAGKLLAKAGFFVLILKFWKIIAVAVAGFGGAIWKWFKGRKEDEIATGRDTGNSTGV
jgi:uncharacterized membrane-anchored protein